VLAGRPCDAHGNPIPPNSPPPPPEVQRDPDDWTPFEDRHKFETAELLFTHAQMSAGHIDKLLELWSATLLKHDDEGPFGKHTDMYKMIDSIPLGHAPWESFSVIYDGQLPDDDAPSWMTKHFDVWYRDPRTLVQNMLSNPDFKNEFDYAPLQEYDMDGNHRFQHFMSGIWAWKQAVHSRNYS